MDIKKLCYELYKREWTDKHISKERQYDAVKSYYENLVEFDDDEEYTFEDYLEDSGYGGELYAGYDEFLDYEYNEKDYMRSLLKDRKFIEMYEKDIAGDFPTTIIVTDIEWDALQDAGLPKRVEIIINEDNDYLLDNWDGEAEEICDWLSDEYDYCLFGFCVEVINM